MNELCELMTHCVTIFKQLLILVSEVSLKSVQWPNLSLIIYIHENS